MFTAQRTIEALSGAVEVFARFIPNALSGRIIFLRQPQAIAIPANDSVNIRFAVKLPVFAGRNATVFSKLSSVICPL
jgi:hypothetical protein